MSIFLIFCVLAAAGWLLLSVTNRDASDRPDASVAAYSRAMAALTPHDEHPAPRPASRPARGAAVRAPRRGPRARTAAPAHRRPGSAPRATTRR